MLPAIFLDRDGVIIENRAHYVRSWDEVEVFPQALQALQRLKNSPYKILIVTNQAGIGHGLIAQRRAEEINQRLGQVIAEAGGRLDGVYVCPHRPSDGCTCRKPAPGLLLKAAEEHGLDLSRSIMIGDALTDVQAGRAAGVEHAALVLTGRGAAEIHTPQAQVMPPFPVYADLQEALASLAPVNS